MEFRLLKLKKPVSVLTVLILIAALSLIALKPSAAHAAGNFTTYRLSGYGNGWYFKVFVPDSYDGSSVPLMIMLHGCEQNADDFAAGTRMNQLAEQKNFIVLYPEMNNYYNGVDCWNWFYDYNQHRNVNGEADIIGSMMKWTINHYNIRGNQIYVAGMSAGGFMASIVAATYPDYIDAVGIHSGGMYNAADSISGATYAMSYGSSYSPDSAGYDAAYEMSKSSLHPMPTIIFHGTADHTVNIENAFQARTQWAQTNDYADDGTDNNSVDANDDQEQSGITNGYSWDKFTYNDANGRSLIELWRIHGLGHAWSGGSTSGSYTDPNGPNATSIMWNFFTSH